MEIYGKKHIINSEYGYPDDVSIYCVHVKISNIDDCAKEIIQIISDTSWLNNLGVVERASLEARARPTIEKLVGNILSKVTDKVTDDFGEYLVSSSAQKALIDSYDHKGVPLAELIKEKISGNPGFDFHTETHTGFIAFGEAKYSGSASPYTDALTQINDFVDNQKDIMECALLQSFVSEQAMANAMGNAKAFIAAFSVNAVKPDTVMKNAVKSTYTQKLTCHKELYLIGVEVDNS